MDDINFGVTSIHEGRAILSELNELLNMQGVRLNTGKTKLMGSAEASQHFWVQDNRQLNVSTNTLTHGAGSSASDRRLRTFVRARFARFVRHEGLGNWSKVLKRYFTVFGKLADDHLVSRVPNLLDKHPEVRDSIFHYYRVLGYSPARFRHIESYLLGGGCVDDVSMFSAARLVMDWSLPRRSVYRVRSVKLAWQLGRNARGMSSPVISGLWLMAKYGAADELRKYLDLTEGVWSQSQWAGRQVAAVTPRLAAGDRRRVIHLFSNSGLLEALRVLSHLAELRRMDRLDRQMSMYLKHPVKPPFPYPFPKVLITLNLLLGQASASVKRDLRDDVLRTTGDPVHHQLLDVPLHHDRSESH